jgi:hypothetical protein
LVHREQYFNLARLCDESPLNPLVIGVPEALVAFSCGIVTRKSDLSPGLCFELESFNSGSGG